MVPLAAAIRWSTRGYVLTRCTWELARGFAPDWHPAPRRQFVVLLTGAAQITVSDGETRSFRRGSVFLVEDTVGTGHQTRALGSDECLYVTVAC